MARGEFDWLETILNSQRTKKDQDEALAREGADMNSAEGWPNRGPVSNIGPHGSWCRSGYQMDDGSLISCDLNAGHDGSHASDKDLIRWDDLGTFGEVLDHWTRRGGPTADERTRFWMSWTRHTIAWTFAVAGCLIVKSVYGGLVDTIATAIGAVTIVALVWQVVDAVRFVIKGRRWQR